MKTGFKHLTRRQERELGDIIAANGQRDGEYWVYNDGWSDSRVAAKTQHSVGQVRHLRKAVFGKVVSKSAPEIDHVKETIADLQRRIERLEIRMYPPILNGESRATIIPSE